MSPVDEGLEERDRLATELVLHLIQDAGGGRTEIPVSHVDATGGLPLWKVTVERVGKLDFEAE